mmetsp:Transcript_21319/g.62066  ORF Transcript_21319/g.62066 Transcript_21319/m.62066 type:complete len:200 (-) Transcript_21319:319-918(-)
MPHFPRAELDEMMERWIRANRDAEESGDWAGHLKPFYAEDAEYRWNMGPNEEYRARGREEICDVALGYHMKGFERWKYPYRDVVVDERRGTVVAFYGQIAPMTREDGTPYEVDGISGSRFEYAGNFQWRRQRDFFDVGNVKSLFFEMAGAGVLEPVVKRKIHEQARGGLLPGVIRLREQPGICTRVNNFFAMIRIAFVG